MLKIPSLRAESSIQFGCIVRICIYPPLSSLHSKSGLFVLPWERRSIRLIRSIFIYFQAASERKQTPLRWLPQIACFNVRVWRCLAFVRSSHRRLLDLAAAAAARAEKAKVKVIADCDVLHARGRTVSHAHTRPHQISPSPGTPTRQTGTPHRDGSDLPP